MTNLKLIPAMVGAIAFALLSHLSLVTAQPASPPASPTESLRLSTQQQKRLQTLEAALAVQLKSILTPSQWQQFQAIQAGGVSQSIALQALTLTDSQRQQIKEVEANTNRQLTSILSRKQQKQLADLELSDPFAALVAKDKVAAPLRPANPSTAPAATTELRRALNLSLEQDAQLQTIEAIIQGQIQAILTPSQWQQLQSLQTPGQPETKIGSTLALSALQMAQLKEVESLAQEQLLAILTREQKEQLLTLQGSQSSSLPSPPPAASSTGSSQPNPPSVVNPPSAPDPFADLNLTASQQIQVDSIQSLLAGQLKTILTPQQWETLADLRAQGVTQDSALRQLALSAQQTQQLKEAESLAEQRLLLLLTPEQQEILRKKVQS
ncbi:MAG: hypothetical protein HC934_11620 [Acaryochloridaceae cyanobacterium SU_2_1]|nr:hypothetical protein [Acaryochloridaceae cyanobacterium SU_2_1]NJM95122.1 hypothetical protein [Acaryochloridaceae cyanobacterium CSU_5_19]